MPLSPFQLNLNLDCMSPEELVQLATHLRTLAEYARRKSEAMTFRAGGQLGSAQRLEAVCDDLYVELPTNWRW